ncbi:hypothetical protein OZ911_08285 [Pseudomonas fortuita]|jgi:hypothetical protein|uniref:Uncharacterized protein n=1 Tax=Pseudomonas fortuita TaxID=3233375 RepID=A0ACD4PBM0_9PSED|nr:MULTISPECIES: hypothetical protein [Pseudomonas]WAP65382.1 hypothetical protein OZ911_08285 [Pseudomonas putida]
MPTENRSSTIEQHDHIEGIIDMVSVPREWLNSVALLQMPLDELQEQAIQHLCEPCNEPAPQPHPEPIAWMVGTAFWWTNEEAERDVAATGLPIVGLGPMSGLAPAEQNQGQPYGWAHDDGKEFTTHADYASDLQREGIQMIPLYTRADSGEVERLREALKLEQEATTKWQETAVTLGAQLAEQGDASRNALEVLRRIIESKSAGVQYAAAVAACHQLNAALSASAEPSVPGKQGAPLGAVRAPEIQDLLDRAATAIGQYGDSLLGRGQREDSVDLLDLEREVRDLEQQFKGAFAQPST